MKVHLIIGLLIFLLMGGICSADDTVGGIPLVTVQQGEVSGGVYCDSFYYTGIQQAYEANTIDKTFTLPSYTDIEWAMLMVDVYCGNMQTNYPGWANVTFNSHLNDNLTANESLNVSYTFRNAGGDGYVIVNNHTNRVSSDYLMWYNVTNLIQPGNNIAIVHTENNNCPDFDGRIIHVTLVVAYNDDSGDTIYYCINKGHDVDSYNLPSNYIGITNFTASIPTDKIVPDATLTVVHRASTDGTYTFNGGSIPSGTPQGNYSGSNIWDVTSSFNQNGNNTLTYDRVAQFYKIQLGLLTAKYQDMPDLHITDINAYHYDIWYPPFLNLSNEVNITVHNNGAGPAGLSNVSLYANDVFIGKTDVPALASSSSATVQIMWTPSGTDCEDGGSPITYSLKAIADCDGELIESDEGNNESTTYSEKAYWNGYSADEHLTTVLNGTIQGGLYYTTGNGTYVDGGLTVGETQSTGFGIGTSIPGGAQITLARLNVYYCWSHDFSVPPVGMYPSMEVSIINSSGTHVLSADAVYTDRPCDSTAVGYDYPYGNNVYDITDYVKGESSITVNVKNVGTVSNMFCPSAPGIVILYEDATKPTYDYWLVEGADLLQGGRRMGCGYLNLSECICNATFTGSVSIGSVETATLGIVSPWAGGSSGFESFPSYYWFNDNYLYDNSSIGGYSTAYSKTVNDMTMYVSVDDSPAQVGVNVSDVTGHIVGQDNTVSFLDDGDSMMPANAFLMIESKDCMCGDVNDNGEVNMGDVTLLGNHVGHPGNPRYAINSCGDVNGNGEVNMGDVTLLGNYVGHPGNPRYIITC